MISNKLVKKLGVVALVLVMVFAMAACSNDGDDELTITSVEEVPKVSVDYGTSSADVISSFPASVDVTLSNDEVQTIQVAWEAPDDYSATTPGTYTFTGSFTVEGITDDVDVDVTVEAQEALTVSSVSAINGTLTLTLSEDVTEVPEDLTVKKDGTAMDLDADAFAVVEGEVEVIVPAIEATAEEQVVEYGVKFGDAAAVTTELTVAADADMAAAKDAVVAAEEGAEVLNLQTDIDEAQTLHDDAATLVAALEAGEFKTGLETRLADVQTAIDEAQTAIEENYDAVTQADIVAELDAQNEDLNLDAVEGDLTLPDRRVVGDDVFDIEWTSDTPEVISNDGVVTRPTYEEGDATVTLTAKLTLVAQIQAASAREVDITVKVKALPSAAEQKVMDYEAIEDITAYSEVAGVEEVEQTARDAVAELEDEELKTALTTRIDEHKAALEDVLAEYVDAVESATNEIDLFEALDAFWTVNADYSAEYAVKGLGFTASDPFADVHSIDQTIVTDVVVDQLNSLFVTDPVSDLETEADVDSLSLDITVDEDGQTSIDEAQSLVEVLDNEDYKVTLQTYVDAAQQLFNAAQNEAEVVAAITSAYNEGELQLKSAFEEYQNNFDRLNLTSRYVAEYYSVMDGTESSLADIQADIDTSNNNLAVTDITAAFADVDQSLIDAANTALSYVKAETSLETTSGDYVATQTKEEWVTALEDYELLVAVDQAETAKEMATALEALAEHADAESDLTAEISTDDDVVMDYVEAVTAAAATAKNEVAEINGLISAVNAEFSHFVADDAEVVASSTAQPAFTIRAINKIGEDYSGHAGSLSDVTVTIAEVTKDYAETDGFNSDATEGISYNDTEGYALETIGEEFAATISFTFGGTSYEVTSNLTVTAGTVNVANSKIEADKAEYVAGEDITLTLTLKDGNENVLITENDLYAATITIGSDVYNRNIQFNNGVANMTVQARTAGTDIDVDIATSEATVSETELFHIVTADISELVISPDTMNANFTITATDGFNTLTDYTGDKLVNVVVVDSDGNSRTVTDVDSEDNIVVTFTAGVSEKIAVPSLAAGDEITVTIPEDNITETHVVQ